MALFTPRFVDERFANFVMVFCCFLIELDGERLCSEASVTFCELSESGVVAVVVLVLIDNFFNDDFRDTLDRFFEYIADVSISNSD